MKIKKAVIIFGIVVFVAMISIHQTRWGISVTDTAVLLGKKYNIKSEIDAYYTYGPEDFFSYAQGWEYPEIFPSDKDEDYCTIGIVMTMTNHSFLPHNIHGAYVINDPDNKARIYRASPSIETCFVDGFQSGVKEIVVYLEIYKNGRTDEEIIRDLSELKIELHYSNKVFQLTKTIDLSKVKLSLLDKNPFDPN